MPISPGLISTKASELKENDLVLDKKDKRWARARLRTRCREREHAISFALFTKVQVTQAEIVAARVCHGNYQKIGTYVAPPPNNVHLAATSALNMFIPQCDFIFILFFCLIAITGHKF